MIPCGEFFMVYLSLSRYVRLSRIILTENFYSLCFYFPAIYFFIVLETDFCISKGG